MKTRTASWGNWGIALYEGDVWAGYDASVAARRVGGCAFPCGPHGPCDGVLGSPERAAYLAAIRAWTQCGEIVAPMSAEVA